MSDSHGNKDTAPNQAPRVDPDKRITYFAATHTRGKREPFGIRAVDRGKHVYVIGKTGMGKSTMLENLAIQDIQNGEGIAFIDPHGSTAEKLLDFIPYERLKDVVYFAPFDTDYPMGFNVMEDVGYDKRHLVVSGLMGAFKRIWVDAWSARMEYILQNVLLALLEYPGSTLLDVNRMLSNKPFRLAVVENISDPIVKAFWTEEFAQYTDRYTQEATPAIQNKVGQFVSNPLIRNIVGQPKSTFDLRKMMDEKKIFIVNLSKGRMGETNASLLGSMLTVKIYLAAMSRADESAMRMQILPRFYFYVDEFQSMMNDAFADILSESRKYKLALTLANQYIEQMEEKVRDAVFGNVGTLIVFRVGPFDAEVLKTVFEPTFLAEDLVGLGLGQIYLTLMIDGVGSPPFSAETLPPIDTPSVTYRNDVVTSSRAHFATPREDIEKRIMAWQAEFAPPQKTPKPTQERSSRPDAQSPRPQQGSYQNHNNGSPQRQDRPPQFDQRNDRPVRAEPRQEYRDDRAARPDTRNSPPIRIEVRNEMRNDRRTSNDSRTPSLPRQESFAPTVSPQTDMRDALKNAISQVKREEVALADTRSPLEILRSKHAQQGPPHTPSKPLPSPVSNPQPISNVRPKSPPMSDNAVHADEGVSEELIRRILAGRE